ncbi:MAG TPA: SRPBCC family protein [Polyangia bacterium]|jgi:uncharacterized protein YndB with AHSA1/START domain
MADEDRIEKQIQLRAPRSRVWRALTDADEFGKWFGVKMEGAFSPGATVRGKITHPGFEHGPPMEIFIERIEPETLFSYRWHPFAVDPKADYSKEPTTLVEFRLRDEAGGTLVTVVESGFSKIPAARRAEAFRMNTGGWEAQMKNIARHVEG